MQLLSTNELPYPEQGPEGFAEVTWEESHEGFFCSALRDTTLHVEQSWAIGRLNDGSTYLRWLGLLEFLISPHGHTITYRPLCGRGRDALHTHLGAALSFALIKLGFEPLHSTTVVVDGVAVALMGDCGYGKSSLAAEFLRAGHQLLTDDLLVVRREASGFMAYPGSSRIKLFPEIATRLLGPEVSALELKHLTPKLIIQLGESSMCREARPLKAAYVLNKPSPRLSDAPARIRRLSSRRSFVELARNTFNMAVTDAARLERQLSVGANLALAIPVNTLSYPRRFEALSMAREAIVADLNAS